MYKLICLEGHDFTSHSLNQFVCPECNKSGIIYHASDVKQDMWGYFRCNEKSKTNLMGVDLGGKSCGFEYMGHESSVMMCPKCDQLNKAYRIVNDNRQKFEQSRAEAEKRGEGWGHLEHVTHFRDIGGKTYAVTNKGKVKDIKETKFADDPKGKRQSGLADSSGNPTRKARAMVGRRDWGA